VSELTNFICPSKSPKPNNSIKAIISIKRWPNAVLFNGLKVFFLLACLAFVDYIKAEKEMILIVVALKKKAKLQASERAVTTKKKHKTKDSLTLRHSAS